MTAQNQSEMPREYKAISQNQELSRVPIIQDDNAT